MKAMLVFAALFSTVLVQASERYQGTFYSRHIGVMVLQLELSFKSGEVVESMTDYYREHYDQGQWGDWICENKAVFHKTLKISGAIYRGNGELVGTFQNNRHDQKKGKLILSSSKASTDEFECAVFSLGSVKQVWFQGYDAYVREKNFIVSFSIPASYLNTIPVEEEGIYMLERLDVNGIFRNQRNQIYYSINQDTGGFSTAIERGSIGLKTPQ